MKEDWVRTRLPSLSTAQSIVTPPIGMTPVWDERRSHAAMIAVTSLGRCSSGRGWCRSSLDSAGRHTASGFAASNLRSKPNAKTRRTAWNVAATCPGLRGRSPRVPALAGRARKRR